MKYNNILVFAILLVATLFALGIMYKKRLNNSKNTQQNSKQNIVYDANYDDSIQQQHETDNSFYGNGIVCLSGLDERSFAIIETKYFELKSSTKHDIYKKIPVKIMIQRFHVWEKAMRILTDEGHCFANLPERSFAWYNKDIITPQVLLLLGLSPNLFS